MTIDELKDYIDVKFQEQRQYTDERTRDMETHLLKEFRKWAIPIEGGRRIQTATNLTVEERLAALEDRVKDLEAEED
jgi:hypothetical protein